MRNILFDLYSIYMSGSGLNVRLIKCHVSPFSNTTVNSDHLSRVSPCHTFSAAPNALHLSCFCTHWKSATARHETIQPTSTQKKHTQSQAYILYVLCSIKPHHLAAPSPYLSILGGLKAFRTDKTGTRGRRAAVTPWRWP